MTIPTDGSPADEIRAATEKLRSLVAFLGDNRGPWYFVTPESGYPQSIRNKGVPYLVADCYEAPSIPVFTVAPYIAAMHPGVGKALAQLLDAIALTANDEGTIFANEALTVARQICGEACT